MSGGAHLNAARHGVVVGLAVCCAIGLAGCGSDTDVPDFPVAASQQAGCRTLLDHLPTRIADEAERPSTGSAFAAVYGDPPIIVRCGVSRPKDYATDPCVTRDGIGWSIPLAQTEDNESDVTLTLAHRTPVLQVVVPAHYRPNGPSEVMADLDQTVRSHTTAQGRCT